MNFSMAGSFPWNREFSGQEGQIVEVDAKQARQWLKTRHVSAVQPGTPLTDGDPLVELSVEDLLGRPCRWCSARATRALGNFGYCKGHYAAQVAADLSSEV
jgi:hypothetical protein